MNPAQFNPQPKEEILPSPLKPEESTVIHHTKNLYPVVRHVILVVSVLFFIALTIFLIHQNGKSIYDNGI